MTGTIGSIGANLAWTRVDVLTPYQRMTADIQIRGRLAATINDPEPLFHLRNVSAEPLQPGAVPLNGVPEGLFSKAQVCGIRTIEAEAPLPDQAQMEIVRRYAMFQGASFMVTGAAEFPKAADQKMHTEILMKAHFFPLVDVTVTIIGANGKSWTQSSILVNRDQMLALYLG